MKRVIGPVVLVTFWSFTLCAQDVSIMRPPDTLALRNFVFPPPENSLWLSSPLPISETDSVNLESLPPGFLRSEMLSNPLIDQDRLDLSSSLKLQWQQEDRFNFLRTALGFIQAGGDAYLLYRAQKKYHYIR